MRFRACTDAPKSCECPLPENHTAIDAVECTCCVHTAKSTNYLWTRKGFCKDGEECVMRCFPIQLQEQWNMMIRCMSIVGMGAPEISVEKFKFFISDIEGIEKQHWADIYDILFNMLMLTQKYKDGSTHINMEDITQLKELTRGN